MRFAELNEICEWCAECGLVVGNSFDVTFPSYPYSAKLVYEVDGKPKLSSEAAGVCLVTLGAWDEVLVWITQWGIWSSSEDWPSFYSWRGSHGEKRDLQTAPGHLFTAGEAETLRELIEKVMIFGWDAHLISPEQRDEINRRIEAHEANPGELLTWDQVLNRLRKSTK